MYKYNDVKKKKKFSLVGVLEDPVGASVHLDDVGAGGQHGDDAVGLLSHLSWRIHHLHGSAINNHFKT